MVDLILDTNIWISHIAKDKPSGIFDSFKKQVSDGDIILLTNDIILDEWKRNKENIIKEITKEIKNTSKNATKIRPFLDPSSQTIIDELFVKISANENERIKLAEKRIMEVEVLMSEAIKMEVTDEMKVTVANWALDKRAPFKQKSNSVGDALILLSVVKHRENDGSSDFRPGFFISFNHTDYSQREDPNEIHEDLQELLDGANLAYERNIGQVLKLTPELNQEVHNYIDSYVEYHMEEEAIRNAEIARGK